jgi:uncharacterized Zn-finger protein
VTTNNDDIMFTEINPTPRQGGRLSRPLANHNGLSRCPTAAIRSSGTTAASLKSASACPHPHDHPHIYIDMGGADTILCPYCGTRFRFDPQLTPLDAEPPDSFFANHNAA